MQDVAAEPRADAFVALMTFRPEQLRPPPATRAAGRAAARRPVRFGRSSTVDRSRPPESGGPSGSFPGRRTIVVWCDAPRLGTLSRVCAAHHDQTGFSPTSDSIV